MSKYRQTLTLITIGGQSGVLLECLKSEKKSVVKWHRDNGTSAWMKDAINSTHNDGKPKHIFIAIQDEGIYQIYGQPMLSGLYCFYTSSRGGIVYAPIAPQDQQALFNAKAAGSSYRNALIALGKKVF
ncbi:hypothetical protein [Lysobacter enzymogenes]|uniref:hypothetical protein n=1 Tax=Lysobacter enzymogenes TaxID=69 RepID=UPI00089C5E32|nr:hypothetical protein [Lysobacter enzymogenes]SDW85273.1 hypothetical protein SAMN05421681_10320 [Lysobacter enzymogenes]